MDEPEAQRSAPKARGMPLWTVFLSLFVLALVSIGVLGFILFRSTNEKAKLERELKDREVESARAELDRQKSEEQAKLALISARQNEVLIQIRGATNAIGSLLQALKRAEEQAFALATNSEGKGVAIHSDLVNLARRIYQNDLPELPKAEAVIKKFEGQRRLELEIASALGKTYDPDPNIATTAQADAIWAKGEISKVERVQTLLDSLVKDSKAKVPPDTTSGSPATLAVAISDLDQAEALLRQSVLAKKSADAKAQATQTIAEAESNRIITEAQVKAAEILAKANEQVQKQLQDNTRRAAERKIEESKVAVAAVQAIDEAQKIRLRQKASDPNVQVKLAPFLTPGFHQLPGDSTYEKAPHSYTRLKNYGALTQSEDGLQRLVNVAHNRQDKDRPRWFAGVSAQVWTRNPAHREMVMEVQKLLIELGPVLVEMGMLRP